VTGQRSSRVVVIGAGVGGLAVAARLAVKGHSVTICEQGNRVGGKLHTYAREGYAFDTGPSLFTLPAVYRDLFLKTGASLEDSVDLQPVEPAFHYHFSDGSDLLLPGVDPAKCADAIAGVMGAEAGQQWRAFMERAGEMWRLTRQPFLQSPLKGFVSLLPLAKPKDIATIAPFTTLRKFASKTFTDPRLITLVDRYATYTGSDPRKAPAVLATVPYIEQIFGAWHIGGGVGTLATALESRCIERGVTIELNTSVSEILTTENRVTGVRLDSGRVIEADIVVSDSDARLTYKDLLADSSAKKPKVAGEPSLAGFVMLIALRGRTPELAHHNVWFPADYDSEFDSIFGKRPQPVVNPAIYVCSPDDPLMRPNDNSESWFILINAPRHDITERAGVNWDAPGLKESYSEHIVELLAQRGVDIRDRIEFMEVHTPADLERTVNAPGGSIYGTSSNGVNAAFNRPANQSPIEGLYLVGGSAHPGGGLPLVGMGAEITAELIGRAQ
jgi:phytoene desaturase